MSNLIKGFREIMGKEKLGIESAYTPSYSTGIWVADYANGKIEDGVVSTGIDGGKIVYVIGKAGVGKTTFAIQMATKIVSEYEASFIVHMDFERATKPVRIKALTGWTEEQYAEKYVHMDRGISAETFYKTVKALARQKLDNFEELKIATGRKDRSGRPIFIMPPSVVILDSLAVMSPDKIEGEEELSGQMSATAIAKANTQIFKRIMGSLEDANIILIVINHINTKVDINPMMKTAADVNFLKQDETLPGGKAPVYLANTLIKLVAGSKLKEEEGYGIKGYKVIGELIKSRSAAAGTSFTMIYHPVNGYTNELSCLELVKENKLLEGNGRAYYIKSCPDVKFTLKNFIEKYRESETLRSAFDELVKEILVKTIPTPEKLGESSGADEDTLEWDEEAGCYVDRQGNYYNENGEPIG